MKLKLIELKNFCVEDLHLEDDARTFLLEHGYRYIFELILLSNEEIQDLCKGRTFCNVLLLHAQISRQLFSSSLPKLLVDFESNTIGEFPFLSKTAKNILFFNGVKKISELSNYSPEQIKELKRIDSVTINEVCVIVESYKRLLGETPQDKSINLLDSPISIINELSNRAKNQLTNAGYKTLREIEYMSINDLKEIKSIGKGTAEEIYLLINKIKNEGFGSGMTEQQLWINDVCNNGLYLIVGDEFVDPRDCSITRVFNNKRLIHQLNDNGIFKMNDLLIRFDELQTIITSKTYKDFILMMDDFFKKQLYCCKQNPKNDHSNIYNHCYFVLENYYSRNELNFLLETNNINSLLDLLNTSEVLIKFEKVIYSIIGSSYNAMTIDEINSYFSNDVFNISIEKTLHSLIAKKLVYISDDGYSVNRISIVDALKLTNAASFDIDIQFLSGLILDEIGKARGVTRERIRQLIKKDMDVAKEVYPKVYEDAYIHLYKTYDIDKDTFAVLTGSQVGYKYARLMTTRDKDPLPLEEGYFDINVPNIVRKKISENNVVGDTRKLVILNGEKVVYKKNSVFTYMCSKVYPFLCLKPNKWGEYFDKFCEENKLFVGKSCSRLGEHYFANMIHAKNGFRYYDYNQDFDNLIQSLDLRNIHNIEISTEVLFRNNLLLMKKYDLRDNYELHNLLRRLVEIYDLDHISFSRAPMVSFDDFSRFDYYEQVMLSNNTISIAELSKIIQDKIGLPSGTANNEAFNAYHLYADNIKPILNDVEKEKLNRDLKDHYYLKTELMSYFKKEFTDINFQDLTPLELKSIGFIERYDGYFFNCKTREEYLNYLLKENDHILNLNTTNIKGLTESNLYNALDVMQSKRLLFAVSNKVYISKEKLLSLGIDLNMLDSYCDEIASLVSEKEYFSVKSIVKKGHQNNLYNMGLNNYFFSKVLMFDSKHRFVSQRVGFDEFILKKGQNSFSLKDVLSYFIGNKPCESFKKIRSVLKDELGVSLSSKSSVDKFIYKIEQSGFYYDSLSDNLYRNESDYLNELENDK